MATSASHGCGARRAAKRSSTNAGPAARAPWVSLESKSGRAQSRCAPPFAIFGREMLLRGALGQDCTPEPQPIEAP